jgi:hypothetical protein
MPRKYEHYDSRYTDDNNGVEKRKHLEEIAQRRQWLKGKCQEIRRQPLDPNRFDVHD